MSGLREDRVFRDELVRGIRVLWWEQVAMVAAERSSLASPLPQVLCMPDTRGLACQAGVHRTLWELACQR